MEQQIEQEESPSDGTSLSGAAFVSCKLFTSAGKTKATCNMQLRTCHSALQRDPLEAAVFGSQALRLRNVCQVERGNPVPRTRNTYRSKGVALGWLCHLPAPFCVNPAPAPETPETDRTLFSKPASSASIASVASGASAAI